MVDIKKTLDLYKSILKREGISGKKMAESLGMSYSSYKSATMSKAKIVPRWVNSFLKGIDIGENRKVKE